VDNQGPAQSRERIDWIDFIKGVAIILVVYGHVVQGAAYGGLLDGWKFFQISEAFIYSFHMPAFFFVSGMLAGRSLQKGTRIFIRDRLKTLAWPYLIWSVIDAFSVLAFRRFYHHPSETPLTDLLTIAWNPHGFWFLFVLFWSEMVLCALRKISAPILFVVFCAIRIAFSNNGIDALDKLLAFLPFLIGGYWLGGKIGGVGQPHLLSFGIGALAFQCIAIAAGWQRFEPIMLLLGFTGTFALISLGVLLKRGRAYDWLCVAGTASLAIFLLHPYLQGLTRVLLSRVAHVSDPWVQVALQTACAVLGAILVWRFSLRTGLWILFTLKKPAAASRVPTPFPSAGSTRLGVGT
jgi:fucose 4-O-acetylase-like acetyltransferase